MSQDEDTRGSSGTTQSLLVTPVRKIAAITVTEMKRALHDRMGVFFMFLFPLLLVFVIGTVFGSSDQAFLGVTAPSDDDLAAEVVGVFESDDGIQVEMYGSEDSLRRAVERGAVSAGVVIPEGYSERLTKGESVEVGFLARPESMGATLEPVVRDAVGPQSVRVQAARFTAENSDQDFDEALSQATALQSGEEPGLGVAPVTTRTVDTGEAMFPSSLGQFDVGASQMLLLFVFVNGLASSAVLIQARQLGVARRMLSTPTSVRTVLLGEAVARYAVTLFQGVYIMVGSALLFGVDWGSFLASFTLVAVFALVAAGAAMLAGAVFSNDEQATSVGVMAGLGVAALGGSMAPLEIYSSTMRDIAHVTPHAWGNDAFATLVRHGGSVIDILPELGVLAAMAVALLALASWRLRLSLTKT